MKTVAALLVFAILAFVAVEGQPAIGIKRCLCQGSGVKQVRPNLIKKVEIHPVGPSCPHLEIVVTLKNDAGQRCLNTESVFAKNIIKRIDKKRRSAQ